MAVTPTYPGVYVSEIPSGNRTIVGVATSITAFVGPADRGPADDPQTISSFADYQRIFGGLSRSSCLGHAVADFYRNGGGKAIVVRVTGAKAAAASWAIPAGPEKLNLVASGPGAWANSVTVGIRIPAGDDAKVVAEAQGVAAGELFTLDVDAGTLGQETHLNVTVVDGPRRIDNVLRTSSMFLRAAALPKNRPGAATKVAATPGVDDATVGPASYIGDDKIAREADKTGLYALLRTDLFNLLCLPPPGPGVAVPAAVWAKAAQLCTDRRAFLIVDPAQDSATAAGIGPWVASIAVTGPQARNAAVFFPWIVEPDLARGGAQLPQAPSGAVAGVFARTDATRGVWKAPAGIDAGLSGVSGLSVDLTDTDSGNLNPVAINCLRTFRDSGTVIWGSRTRRGADVLSDDYKYVPVRRTALFIEESLFRGTQWVVFEPNDEPLWAQIRASVGAFMHDLFRQGAFQGASPKEAYFVSCGKDTTTQYDIDRGIVNIQVGFAPLKPAEFVMISIQQLAGQKA